MEVKIISGFGENIFLLLEESVCDVLKEASKQAKNSLEEDRDAGKGQPETKAEESEAEKPGTQIHVSVTGEAADGYHRDDGRVLQFALLRRSLFS